MSKTPQDRLLDLAETRGEERMNELVAQYWNCDEEASGMDADGDVWIEGPMTGHWVHQDRLADFADWIEECDL